MRNFLARVIWAGRYNFKLVLFALMIFVFGGLYFAFYKPDDILNSKPVRETEAQGKPTITESSYSYQSIYKELRSKGIVLIPLEHNETLSQVFPKSKIWKFTSEGGRVSYLADGEDKTERSVINDQVLRDKRVDFSTIQTDFDGDRKIELISFTIISFKDVALCCNEKRFFNVFKKNEEGKWILLKEKGLGVYYGGKHTGKIGTRTVRDFSVIEIITEGYYYNGLKTSTAEWYIWQDQDFKQVWRQHLFYNADSVGTFSQEAMNNYQAYFELISAEEEKYPRIKVIKTYTKKAGENLKNAQREEIYYLWDNEKKLFQRAVTPQEPDKQE